MATVDAAPYRIILDNRIGRSWSHGRRDACKTAAVAEMAGIDKSLADGILDCSITRIEVADAAAIVMGLGGQIVLPGAGGGTR